MGRTSPCLVHAKEILRLNDRGLGRREIARNCGLSYNTVQAYLQRRGIRPTHPIGQIPAELDGERVQAMIDSGKVLREIAAELGVHVTTIQRHAKELGLAMPRPGPKNGARHPSWAGGRMIDKHGYVLVWVPLHPHSRKTGYVYEHRLLMEAMIGRYLEEAEVPNHVDGHPRHNWPSNLALHATNAAHLIAELTGRPYASSQRYRIPGAYRSTQKLDHCPGEDETLAQCPAGKRAKLVRHVEIHRPTTAQQNLSRQSILRSGAHHQPFQ